MRKLVVVVALIVAVVFAAASGALEVNGLRTPKVVAAGATDSLKIVVAANAARNLPSGVIAFSGDGNEFFVRYMNEDGTFSAILGVPGSMTLPRPQAQRRGDSLYCVIEITANADSVSAMWVDQ